MRRWRLSCREFTMQVNTDEDGTIVWAAPIVRKFVGKPIKKLVEWKNCEAEELYAPEQGNLFS